MHEGQTDTPLEKDHISFRDDEGDVVSAFVEHVEEAIAIGASETIRELITDLHASDLGALLASLSLDQAVRLIELAGSDFDFEALTELEETTRVQIMDRLPTHVIVEGVRDLDSDDVVYILEDLEQEDQDEILAELPAPDRAALKRSLDYPEDTAGRRMKTEFIAIPPFWTVGQTIDYLRESKELPDSFYEIYVIDPGFRLLGHVALDRLLRNKRHVLIEALMLEADQAVYATDDQEDVARLFERYNLVSAAVLDEADRLVGVLTADDIVDVIQEEADEDLKALAGVKADEEISDSVVYITRSRFSWLFVNLLTAILASAVIGFFENELQKVVALAILMPIVASQGGNAGTQTMAVAVRAIATEVLTSHNASRFVLREVSVGVLNGLLFATIMGGVAAVWFSSSQLGITIAFAMLVNMVAAGMAGVLVPITLERFGVDPAVASGPFVTTVTDVVGFFAFLGFATWWLGL